MYGGGHREEPPGRLTGVDLVVSVPHFAEHNSERGVHHGDCACTVSDSGASFDRIVDQLTPPNSPGQGAGFPQALDQATGATEGTPGEQAAADLRERQFEPTPLVVGAFRENIFRARSIQVGRVKVEVRRIQRRSGLWSGKKI